jgi:hypothetical protein
MKCLSVRQPWAWGLIFGEKRIENRGRAIRYRGPLLIHAARSLAEFADNRDYSRLMPELPPLEDIPFGMILGIVDVIDCVPFEEVVGDPFAEGPWCWITENPRPIEPVPFRGALSLFDVPDDLIRPLEFKS